MFVDFTAYMKSGFIRKCHLDWKMFTPVQTSKNAIRRLCQHQLQSVQIQIKYLVYRHMLDWQRWLNCPTSQVSWHHTRDHFVGLGQRQSVPNSCEWYQCFKDQNEQHHRHCWWEHATSSKDRIGILIRYYTCHLSMWTEQKKGKKKKKKIVGLSHKPEYRYIFVCQLSHVIRLWSRKPL